MKSSPQEAGRDAARTRQRILTAADDLFGAMGFDATTTREIAERSGVNKALIHYHFKSKDGLLAAVLDRYYETLAGTLLAAIQAGVDLGDKAERLVDTYVDYLAKNRNFHRIVQREASGGRHMDRVHGHTKPLFEIGIRLIEEAFPSTRSGEMAAGQLLVSVYGMIISYFTYDRLLGQLMDFDPLAPENLAMRKHHLRRMFKMILRDIEAHDDAD